MAEEERLELPDPSQARLRADRALRRRQARQETRRFLAEGRQAVREALKLPHAVESLYVRWDAALHNSDLIERARAQGTPVYALSEQNLATLTDTVSPQGVVAVARNLDIPLEQVFSPGLFDAERPEPKLVVICAQVRDPGNAGTVIRCADAFGADAVILSSDSVELYNPKVVRASVGSIFHLPIVTGADLAAAIAACRAAGMQVLAADGHAKTDLSDIAADLPKPTAWVMGNESWGLPVEHLALADKTVAVPIYGQAESLNLATAAAVFLYSSATAIRGGITDRFTG
ncbi:MAG: RNA methyltransferase [Propionibacteriaceae bacterium]|jgi:TrmH family RNA methyltransferase|nr:RNA methyltransferase [Propionibacteriaceae bacterium]